MKKIRVSSKGGTKEKAAATRARGSRYVGGEGLPVTAIREIRILKRLSGKHINLVELIEIVTSKGCAALDDGGENDQREADAARHVWKGNLFLVLEYVEHDLSGLMDKQYPFTPITIKCIMKQLFEALNFIHEQGFVHRDIKSSNLLITNHHVVKLADFGLARSLRDQGGDKHEQGEFTNRVITLWYRPPELLLGTQQYGFPVDMWSAGCILAELLRGKPLMPGKDEASQIALIFDVLGSPTPEVWRDRKYEAMPHWNTFRPAEPKPCLLESTLKEKVIRRNEGCLELLQDLLALDPMTRIRARSACRSHYFQTDPKLVADPSQLPTVAETLGVENGASFHEFETKGERKRDDKQRKEKEARERKKETGKGSGRGKGKEQSKDPRQRRRSASNASASEAQ